MPETFKLENVGLAMLRMAAQKKNISGYTTMNEKALILALKELGVTALEITPDEESEASMKEEEPGVQVSSVEDVKKFSLKELREYAKDYGIDPTDLSKEELAEEVFAAAMGEQGEAEDPPEEEEGEDKLDTLARPALAALAKELGLSFGPRTREEGLREMIREAYAQKETSTQEEEPEEEDAPPDLESMSREELVAFIQDNELDVAFSKKTSVETLRGLVQEAILEKEDEESTPAPEAEPPVEVNLDEMNREELLAFIQEQELEISVGKKTSEETIRQLIREEMSEEEPEEVTPELLAAMLREDLLALAETMEVPLPVKASTERIRALLKNNLFGADGQINSGPFPPQSEMGLLLHFLNEAEEPLKATDLVEKVMQHRLPILQQSIASNLAGLITDPKLKENGMSIEDQEGLLSLVEYLTPPAPVKKGRK